MTSPIAKAIAERIRKLPEPYGFEDNGRDCMDFVAEGFELGAYDDLLPAYTTEVATVGNTRYLMPSEPLYLADASNLTTADGRIVEWRPTQPPTSWWRMVAVMRERLRAGESVESVAADYGTPEDVVTMLADAPAGRPVLSDSTIRLLIETAQCSDGTSAEQLFDECMEGAGEPLFSEYSLAAAELRAWEAWRAKRQEGGT